MDKQGGEVHSQKLPQPFKGLLRTLAGLPCEALGLRAGAHSSEHRCQEVLQAIFSPGAQMLGHLEQASLSLVVTGVTLRAGTWAVAGYSWVSSLHAGLRGEGMAPGHGAWRVASNTHGPQLSSGHCEQV